MGEGSAREAHYWAGDFIVSLVSEPDEYGIFRIGGSDDPLVLFPLSDEGFRMAMAACDHLARGEKRSRRGWLPILRWAAIGSAVIWVSAVATQQVIYKVTLTSVHLGNAIITLQSWASVLRSFGYAGLLVCLATLAYVWIERSRGGEPWKAGDRDPDAHATETSSDQPYESLRAGGDPPLIGALSLLRWAVLVGLAAWFFATVTVSATYAVIRLRGPQAFPTAGSLSGLEQFAADISVIQSIGYALWLGALGLMLLFRLEASFPGRFPATEPRSPDEGDRGSDPDAPSGNLPPGPV